MITLPHYSNIKNYYKPYNEADVVACGFMGFFNTLNYG